MLVRRESEAAWDLIRAIDELGGADRGRVRRHCCDGYSALSFPVATGVSVVVYFLLFHYLLVMVYLTRFGIYL